MRRPYYGSILFLVILNLYSLILLSCSKNGTESNDNTITVSGKVTLEGQSDHSGVTVRLYKPVTLDTALVRINQQYPNIGVKISQETEFDHRQETASYSTTTNANGDWRIENVAAGTYNVIAEKDGFGWRYTFDVKVENSVGSLNFGLFGETEITQISSSFNFLEDRHYILKNNIDVPPNVTLTFNNGAYLRLEENVILRIQGAVNFSNQQYVHIICNKTGSRFSRVEFQSNNNTIKNVLVNSGRTGLGFSNTSNIRVEKCIVKNALDAIFFNSGVNNQILNNLVCNNQNGLSLVGTSGSLVQKNIIYLNDEVGLNNQQAAENNSCLSNYFKANNEALVFLESASGLVKNNIFDENSNFSFTIVGSKPVVRLNNFVNASKGLKICSSYQQQSYLQSQPLINFNNFIAVSSYSIDLSSHPVNPSVYYNNSTDIDAVNNFWNTASEFEIQNKIYDKSDFSPLGIVNYNPYAPSMIDSAGIR